MDFPLFKLGTYKEIETTLMGKVYIDTGRGRYILDDKSIPYPSLAQRRLRIKNKIPLYKFRGTVNTLRELVKHPSNTKFMDRNGNLFKYKKGNKRYKVVSHEIIRKEKLEYNRYVIYIKDVPTPQLLDNELVAKASNYASVIHTKDGPLIYDYTSEPHDVYRRSI